MTLDARRLLADLLGADRKAAHRAQLVLGGLEPDDEIDIATLADSISLESHESLVFWATIALGRLGPKASSACAQLAEVARSHQAFGLREVALASLVKMAPSDVSTKATVLAGLDDPDARVRRQALQSSIEVRSLTASDFERIASKESDSDADVRRWAEIAMRNITLRARVDA